LKESRENFCSQSPKMAKSLYIFRVWYLSLGTHLFVKVPRPGDSEVTFSVFESKPLKDIGNPVKCLAQRHNKRTYRLNFTL